MDEEDLVAVAVPGEIVHLPVEAPHAHLHGGVVQNNRRIPDRAIGCRQLVEIEGAGT